MSSRRKDSERTFLQRFLALSRRSAQVIDSERPDFILVENDRRTGIELTEIAHRADPRHSSEARNDLRSHRALAALAALYYRAGGRPLMVRMSMAALPVGRDPAALVERLVSSRASMDVGSEARLLADEGDRRAPLDLRALPESFIGFSRWQFFEDVAEPARLLDQDRIIEAIVRKARHLPSYRQGVERVELLLVADRRHDASKWQLPDGFTSAPTHGFDAVHLLMHPYEVRRLA